MLRLLGWIARGLGVLCNLLTLLILLVTFWPPLRDYPPQELPALLGLLTANAGIFVAWRSGQARRGGSIAAIAGVFTAIALYFSCLSIGVTPGMSLWLSIIYGLPGLLVGLLFLLYDWLSRQAMREPAVTGGVR
ncbi:MAG TPA: hypothetical protein VH186_26900 [Chloroflexia bacterium]|nr:hypothetical protein [Chloroflexia bacterium]